MSHPHYAQPPSARTPTYLDAVTSPRRQLCSKVLHVIDTDTTVTATGWRWHGSVRDNWTHVQLCRHGHVVHERTVADVMSSMFASLLSVYVGEVADRVAEVVRSALSG